MDFEGVELYNTAKVQTNGLPTQRIYQTLYSGKNMKWQSWTEIPPTLTADQNRTDTPTVATMPLEQIRFANESSDYLYYSVEIDVASIANATLVWEGRQANAYSVFLDDVYVGRVSNAAHAKGMTNFSIVIPQNIPMGAFLIILSSNLGIDNHMENQQPANAQDMKGITGAVYIKNGANLTDGAHKWYHWIGLTGEQKEVLWRMKICVVFYLVLKIGRGKRNEFCTVGFSCKYGCSNDVVCNDF